MDRIVMLIDMDCFYVQVEQRERPETRKRPCAVLQYNKNGPILAVSYEARAVGVKRGMSGDSAKKACPDIILFKVPEKRGKAELTKYRSAGAEVIKCITAFVKDVERASVDEAYVDLTDAVNESVKDMEQLLSVHPNTESFLVPDSNFISTNHPTLTDTNCVSLNQPNWVQLLNSNFSNGMRYAFACDLAYKIRHSILQETGFECSAGIAPNKTLAKLACSLNKPNKQTMVPPESASILIGNTPIAKIRNLGGKLGAALVQKFNIEMLGQLNEIPLNDLIKEFGEKTANWLYALSRGYDPESVTPRSLPQSIGCSKNFFGRSSLKSAEQIERWLKCLAEELVERVENDQHENHRHPTKLVLYFRTANLSEKHSTKPDYGHGLSRTLPDYLIQKVCDQSVDDANFPQTSELAVTEEIAHAALVILKELFYNGDSPKIWDPSITCLGLSTGKFVADQANTNEDLRSLFRKQSCANDPIQPSPTKRPVESCSSELTTPPKISNTNLTRETIEDPKRGSFFRRLCAAELSSLPSNLQLHKSADQAQNKEALRVNQNKNDSKKTMDVEHDHDSLSSATSETSNFFTSYASNSDWVICDQCGSRVSVWQLPEHSDFHVAQRVQQEWSKDRSGSIVTTLPTSSIVGKKSKLSSNIKNRKLVKNSRIGAPVFTKSMTLDKFLTKQNGQVSK